MTFNDYAEQRGIKLMREDIKFIKNLTIGMSRGARRSVLVEYADIWIKARDSEPRVPAKQNRGRYAANTWLRTRP